MKWVLRTVFILISFTGCGAEPLRWESQDEPTAELPKRHKKEEECFCWDPGGFNFGAAVE